MSLTVSRSSLAPVRGYCNQTRIYFDNAATTPLSPVAREAMAPFENGLCGNPSGPYAVARVARMALVAARSQVAELIGAIVDEVVFTSGGTESDNWALLGVALANFQEKGHIIVSSVEHHAVLEAASTLRTLGFEVDEARADANGVIAPTEIERLLRPSTLLVSVMALNNEIGVIQPVEEIGALCGERKVLFHTDAVQAAGKIPINVEEWNCDLLTLSAHKFGGPKGVGALYIRRDTVMKNLLRGGGQERGRRAGTENVPGIVAFGAAAQAARENLDKNREYLRSLQSELESGLARIDGTNINGGKVQRGPHITNVSFQGERAEILSFNLDLQGIAVGTGAACSSGAMEPSHVLRAMGLNKETASASLRISLGAQNTREEVQEFLQILDDVLNDRDTAII